MEYLEGKSKKLICSEYLKGVVLGGYRDGVQCQDVQNLTYPSGSFDVCTSTEVFEHVPDDNKGFSEIYRVLKPNGIFIFTVPFHGGHETIERAVLTPEGDIQNLLPPEYHSDPKCGHEPILAFRNYGYDILDKLVDQGFARAELRSPGNDIPWGFSRPVVVAYREDVSKKWENPDPLLLHFSPN